MSAAFSKRMPEKKEEHREELRHTETRTVHVLGRTQLQGVPSQEVPRHAAKLDTAHIQVTLLVFARIIPHTCTYKYSRPWDLHMHDAQVPRLEEDSLTLGATGTLNAGNSRRDAKTEKKDEMR